MTNHYETKRIKITKCITEEVDELRYCISLEILIQTLLKLFSKHSIEYEELWLEENWHSYEEFTLELHGTRWETEEEFALRIEDEEIKKRLQEEKTKCEKKQQANKKEIDKLKKRIKELSNI